MVLTSSAHLAWFCPIEDDGYRQTHATTLVKRPMTILQSDNA